MAEFFDFVLSYWGLIGLALIFVLKAIFDWEATKKRIRDLIFLAEELAQKKILETGKEKFEWVKNNGYAYLPKWLKLVISEELFEKIVQNIFDRIKEWAKGEDLIEE